MRFFSQASFLLFFEIDFYFVSVSLFAFLQMILVPTWVWRWLPVPDDWRRIRRWRSVRLLQLQSFFLLFNAHIILCWSTVYIHFYAVILVASAKSRPWRPSGAPVCNSSNKMQLLNHPNPLPSAPKKGRKKKKRSLLVSTISKSKPERRNLNQLLFFCNITTRSCWSWTVGPCGSLSLRQGVMRFKLQHSYLFPLELDGSPLWLLETGGEGDKCKCKIIKGLHVDHFMFCQIGD